MLPVLLERFKTRLKERSSSLYSRQSILIFIVLLVILACSSWVFLMLETNDVFARFNLAGDMASMEKQIEQDLKILEGFSIDPATITELKSLLGEFKKKRARFFYREDLFEEMKNLYDQVNELKEQQQSISHSQIENTLLAINTKFSELEHYGLTMEIKQAEKQLLEENLLTAQTREDFEVVTTLANQLDFFLQDQINVKKTIYLQEHLQEELTAIKELMRTGKGLGIEDQELEEAVKMIDINHTTSSTEYLFQLEKYQQMLVEGKIRLKEAIDKKQRELEEQRQRGSYIAIKPPQHPVSGKSIEVSLDEQVLRCYENGEQIFSSFVVTGKNGWWTTKGVHKILLKQKYKVLTMDGPEYYRIPVKYWMPFTYKGEGIHDATFRRVFGPRANRSWNGSHGCVNSPMATAQFIFYWADVGTPVVVY